MEIAEIDRGVNFGSEKTILDMKIRLALRLNPFSVAYAVDPVVSLDNWVYGVGYVFWG